MSQSTVTFDVQDVSGQKSATVRDCPTAATISEVLPALLDQLQIPVNDTEGNPMAHCLRRDSDGLMLHDGDVIGRVIEQGDLCILQPSVDAGGTLAQ